ncbi:MAG: glycoside hydrolase family 2 [Bacteroidetes bacterium]|nr:MAG: glycoside hydrolase family 2 [Bacteroidota bacterium]
MNRLLGKKIAFIAIAFIISANLFSQTRSPRKIELFTKNWSFHLDEDSSARNTQFNDASWRKLSLPHDWSIELPFDKKSPTGTGGGALRGGVGWYRKTFQIPKESKGKRIFIDFDGVYMNSEVWINGHSLGIRPNGYISFRYELTPFLHFGEENNVITVRVDNSRQPNSRWYSGSGIYRNVWLVTVNDVHVDHWGSQVNTSNITNQSAKVELKTHVSNDKTSPIQAELKTSIYDADSKIVRTVSTHIDLPAGKSDLFAQTFSVPQPILWSIENPYLYKAVNQIYSNGELIDEYITPFGIRFFNFDKDKGFSLNGKGMKIFGVCDHHDLGCLGTAVNKRALQRQLEILKGMGINAIRTSHNPPAPELLDLADEMGFVIMDEAFDMWKRPKNPYDYHLYWDEWHERDLKDQILRDRNHPSIMIWSIGNEIPEQWAGQDGKDTSGRTIARELAGIVRSLDTTRVVTAALDHPEPGNEIYKSGALDLVGFNYHHQLYKSFPEKFPGEKLIGTETVSALQTRGHYDMPSDSIRRWPERWDKPVKNANPDLSCSAYENCSSPWGSTHEETLKELLKYDFQSGMFVWTGFDYIGEPTPYPWPARSSYFGIVDLAGFPKDSYYLYESVCTNKPVLHIFPHWNWKKDQTIDIWAYYNQADEVELFLNGQSLGTRKKNGDDLHVMWRIKFSPGTIKAISRKNGNVVLEKEIHTAGKPAKIILEADRKKIQADGSDLSFITAKIVDANGNLVPDANNLIHFNLQGEGLIAGTDNGSETSLESFRSNQHTAFNGLCLAVVQSQEKPGMIKLTASADGLGSAELEIESR